MRPSGQGVDGSAPLGPVRFRRLELRYGRHARTFELEGGGGPFVIAGPNGSGKSTLMEGLVRTLYGFRRSKRDERAAHGRRRPWAGGAYGGRVWLDTAKGSWSFERDFETDRVRVVTPGAEAPRFEGEANPTRAGESTRRYRALLEEAIGLSELGAYRRTACVFQGGLLGTSLSVDLLRVAAGGHADVETAQARLRDEFRALTLQPIADGIARRRTAGRIETLEAEVSELESAVREARTAEEQRGPLVRERDERRARLREAAAELETLERAFETLSEAARLDEVAEASRGQVRRLEGWTRELDEALARYDLARERGELGSARAFPSDFPERARALEALWPRRDALEEESRALPAEDETPRTRVESLRAAPSVAAAPALFLASVALWMGGARALGGLALGLSLAAAALALMGHRVSRREREERSRRRAQLMQQRREVDAEIASLREGIPDGERLTSATLAAARDRFERESADLAQAEECERALRAAIDHATRALEEAWEDEARAASAEPVPGGLAERARDRLRLLHEAASLEREERLAPVKLQIEELRRVRFDLPSGVDPSVDGVRVARRRCLAECDGQREELASIERDLIVGARPSESALGLEARLESARSELVAQEDRARAYREAYALVGAAYESFRRTDEERLLGAISDHLDSLSGGTLGPLDASAGLDGAGVSIAGRTEPIDSPPLSYGQLHTALLAIRMGAADFLAGLGVRVPLLIDDPFVHLDERSAAELWRILTRVAERRQVIVATQDRLVLDHLGIAPDLDLGLAPVADSSGGDPDPSLGHDPPPGRLSTAEPPSRLPSPEQAPDLWSQLDE